MVSYHGNPERTASSTSAEVFGPLARAWSKRFRGPVNQPLIVGDRVIVNVAETNGNGYGSRVLAFSRASGRKVWERPTPGTYYSAPIAYDQGRVVSVNADGLARAIDVTTGRLVWQAKMYGDGPPVARGGRVFTLGSQGDVLARSVADGRLLWAADGRVRTDDQMPSLDEQRLFLGNESGSVTALDQATGQVAWTRTIGNESFGGETIVSEGRVFAGGGRTARVLDARSGADVTVFAPGLPEALSGGLAFIRGTRTLSAFGAVDGRPAWKARVPGRPVFGATGLPPVAVGGTVYEVSQADRLHGFDHETGALRSTTPVPAGEYTSVGGIRPGVSVGRGVLAVADRNVLSVYGPVLAPGPSEIDAALDSFDLVAGQRVRAVGGIGTAIRRRGVPITMETDRYPYGRFKTAARTLTLGDGTGFLATGKVSRNTRVRLRTGRQRSPTLRVAVFPRFRFGRVRATRRGRGVAGVRVGGAQDLPARGRRVFVYLARQKSHRYTLLGGGRLNGRGKGPASGRVVLRLPRSVGRKDSLVGCIPGLARRGFGRLDALERRCGRRSAPF